VSSDSGLASGDVPQVRLNTCNYNPMPFPVPILKYLEEGLGSKALLDLAAA
jgi:hypothetical protein